MPLVLLGLSHRTAPLAVRDRHAVPSDRLGEALAALADYSAVREAAILSTCNRLEIYADVEAYESGVAQIKEFLTTYRRMRVEDFDKYLYTMLGAQAVEQLLRVASGLDSMLIGEPQILSQVKAALRLAEDAGSIGPHLGRLFRVALQTGKRARSETGIGRDVVSLAAAAVELACRECDVTSACCAVVGAGQMGTSAAKHLHARGAGALWIVNRTLRSAQSLAAQLGAQALGMQDLPALLARCDLLVTAVGSSEFVILESMVRRAMAARGARRLLIIDIGVPRNVEPSAALLAGVVVRSIEDLRDVVDRSLQGRRSEIPRVEAIVAAQTGAYLEWYRTRGAVPVIASLRRKAEEIRSAEIQRLFSRMPELDDRQRKMVVAASVSIINRLLHAPVTKLRERAGLCRGQDHTRLAEELLEGDAFSDRLQRQLDAHLKFPS
jgi:glutamyl-tRNA reductase